MNHAKCRPPFKSFIVVNPDGTVVDAIGSIEVNDSDSVTLMSLLKNDAFKILFLPGDVFILDRGLKTAESFLKEEMFGVKMPAFVKDSESELSWEQANESRKLSK